MRKVILNMKCERQYQIIKAVVDGNKKAARAIVELGISLEHVYRLKKKYKEEGKSGFLHKNTGKSPLNKLSDDLTKEILHLSKNVYYDFNFRHLNEKLKENHNIDISYTKLTNLLNSHQIYSKRIQKRTKKKLVKISKENNLTTDISKQVGLPIDTLPHPRQPRKKNYGEQIQMDASKDVYFGKEKVTLHLAIDNATKRVVGAYFDKEETLNGYYHVMSQILGNHGIPYEILTDRRTIFEYTKLKSPKLYDDTFTNFSYAMQNLGAKLTCSSIPQSKGQIERAFGYWHDRFPPEARTANINDIHEANTLLQKLVQAYNEKIALPLKGITSVFEKQMDESEINLVLTKMDIRKIDNGHCISYKKEYYQLQDQYEREVYLKPKTIVNIIETFNHELYATYNDELFIMKKVEKRAIESDAFDTVETKKRKLRKVYKPPMSHPWKTQSYLAYLEKQKHLNSKLKNQLEDLRFELEINI